MATVDTEQGTRTQADQTRQRGGGRGEGGRQQGQEVHQATQDQDAQRRAEQQLREQEAAQRRAVEEAQRRAQDEARGRDEAAARQARAAAPSHPETYEYPAELPPRPRDTRHALDGALHNLVGQYLEGEQRRSIGQATMPFVLGATAEITRTKSHLFGTMYNALFGGNIAKTAAELAGRAGGLVGLAPELSAAAQTFAATGAVGAVVTGVLSPTVSLAKRVLLGDNAWRQAAAFMTRKEDGGLLQRILWGGESRLMKWSLFRENGRRRQLLRLADQNADMNTLRLGSRRRVEQLIAEGMVAGATAQMLTELNVPTNDKENERLERMVRAYDKAKEIFNAKIPTAGQRENFINDRLPSLVRNSERWMWARQTALITGVGMLKAVSMVGLLQVFTIGNITKLQARAGDVATELGNRAKDVLQLSGDALKGAGNWVQNALGRIP